MAWNRFGDWDGWKEAQMQSGARGWYDPAEAECAMGYDAYGWQQAAMAVPYYGDGCGAGMAMGSNGMCMPHGQAHIQQQQQQVQGHLTHHSHNMAAGSGAANYNGGGRQQLGSSPLYGSQPASAGTDTEDDRMMAELEESMRSMMPLPHDSSDDEEPKRPAEATAEEREEAQRVVMTAFKEAKEREKLREKVKKASPEDLQAMLNARLKRG